MDPPVVVLESFGTFKVDRSFCGSQAIGEVGDQGFLGGKGGAQEPHTMVSVVLLEVNQVDEAIDDLSRGAIVIGMGGQGHEGGAWQDTGSGLLPVRQVIIFIGVVGILLSHMGFVFIRRHVDGDKVETGHFSGERHVIAM